MKYVFLHGVRVYINAQGKEKNGEWADGKNIMSSSEDRDNWSILPFAFVIPSKRALKYAKLKHRNSTIHYW